MTRRTKVPRNAPGEGMISVQTPIAAMLEAGIGIAAYIQLVRDGHLDQARRIHKFSSRAFTVERMREQGVDLLDGLPDIEGDVTWRRGPRHWSLDVTMGNLAPDIFYWGSVARDVSQIRFDGTLLPQAVVDNLPGRPLRDIVEHPFLADPGIVIVSATSGGPYPAMKGIPGTARPAMTQFRITVPTVELPDATPANGHADQQGDVE